MSNNNQNDFNPYNQPEVNQPPVSSYSQPEVNQPTTQSYNQPETNPYFINPYNQPKVEASSVDPYNQPTVDSASVDLYNPPKLEPSSVSPYSSSETSQSVQNQNAYSGDIQSSVDPYAQPGNIQSTVDPYVHPGDNQYSYNPYGNQGSNSQNAIPSLNPYEQYGQANSQIPYAQPDANLNSPQTVNPSINQEMDESKRNKTANILCLISVLCMFLPIIVDVVFSLFSIFTNEWAMENMDNWLAVNSVSQVVVGLGSIVQPLLFVAAIVLVIVVRVKYRESTFGKVLMWIYIVFGIIMAITFVLLCIACSMTCIACIDELKGCS